MYSILIVDDDRDLLEMVCQMIAFSGLRVKGIEDGGKVLECLAAEKFDIILMDIFIGKHDGRVLARQIKADQRFANLPIVLYSAGIISEDSIRESGADAFYNKPFDMNELLNGIHELLNSPRRFSFPAIAEWKFNFYRICNRLAENIHPGISTKFKIAVV